MVPSRHATTLNRPSSPEPPALGPIDTESVGQDNEDYERSPDDDHAPPPTARPDRPSRPRSCGGCHLGPGERCRWTDQRHLLGLVLHSRPTPGCHPRRLGLVRPSQRPRQRLARRSPDPGRGGVAKADGWVRRGSLDCHRCLSDDRRSHSPGTTRSRTVALRRAGPARHRRHRRRVRMVDRDQPGGGTPRHPQSLHCRGGHGDQPRVRCSGRHRITGRAATCGVHRANRRHRRGRSSRRHRVDRLAAGTLWVRPHLGPPTGSPGRRRRRVSPTTGRRPTLDAAPH